MKNRRIRIRLTALALVVLLLTATGCTSSFSIDSMPDGTRPPSLDPSTIAPRFPSERAVRDKLYDAMEPIRQAASLQEQKDAYFAFQEQAFIYILGPYTYVAYLEQDGHNIQAYLETMTKLLNAYVGQFEPMAWSILEEAEWGAQLTEELRAASSLPEKIRTAFPVTNEAGNQATNAVYTSRSELAQALGQEETTQEQLQSLLDTALSSRVQVAELLGYPSYMAYMLARRDNVPYQPQDISKLTGMVKSTLVPIMRSLKPVQGPVLNIQQWNAQLPLLAALLPESEEDVRYGLDNGLLTLEEAGESGPASFAFNLYHYDTTIGKAKLDGSFLDGGRVAGLIGMAARNALLPSSQWAIDPPSMADTVQRQAFSTLAVSLYDRFYGADSEAAAAQYRYDLLQSACRAAMEVELLDALYAQPNLPNSERYALMERLQSEYGLPVDGQQLLALRDVRMGDMQCVNELLSSLTSLQLLQVTRRDAEQARDIVSAMFKVYNYGNPIAEAVKAGLPNPFAQDSLNSLANAA